MPDLRPELNAEPTPQKPRVEPRRAIRAGLLAMLVLSAGGAALYGFAAPAGNSGGCPAASAALERMRPLARGEVAAVGVPDAPRPLPAFAFAGPDGTPKTLADFRGRTVLLNLWATWCVPCRQEMPELDRLQQTLGGADFEVVAINLDTRNPDRPKAWLTEAGIRDLAYYADPEAKVFQEMKRAGKVVGLPTTLLIDPAGCEIAALSGPAQWASADGLALVKAALGR